MKIICDTMSDVPKEIIDKFKVDVVPLTIIINEKEYLDGVDITHDEFYKVLRESNELPKTSQITYIRFKEAFEKFTSKGEDVLYIGGSSAASGTYQSAVMASRDVEGSGCVHTFDTYSLSVCAGTFVVKACLLKEEGKNIEEIIQTLEKSKGSETAFFFVDELTYLQKGGRISSTKAAIGTMLNVKPILTIKDGIVGPKSQIRGKKHVVNTLMKHTKELIETFDDKIIILACCDNESCVEQLKEAILEDASPKGIYKVNIGACISSHSGPSIVGIATI
ncbi:DegV family protein [Romboutsia sp.]|uniref:DegV family protein n=1 Tax=Romboutsia sp. TaxID=1965302 RepID=UPI003F3265F8